MTTLVARADEATLLAPDPAYRPLLGRLVEEPDAGQRDTLGEALRLAADRGLNANDKLARLRQMGREHTDLVELQTLAAQMHLLRRPHRGGAGTLRGRRHRAPQRRRAAQARALAFFALDRFDDALASALDWRRRSARDPLAADLLIARCRLAKNQPREALAVLEPYRGYAEQLPGQMADFAAVYGRALAATGRSADALAFLGPHLSLAEWRSAALSLTPAIARPDERSAWLEKLTVAVPEDNPQERFRLANAWWAFHQAGGTDDRNAPEAGLLALRIVQTLAGRGDASMQEHAAAGMMAEALGRRDDAVSAYRRALELRPDAAAVRNNLAMVLLGDADTPPLDAPAGLAYAREAVAADPDEPNYRDTLALAQVKTGDVQEALRTIEVAVDLEPGNPLWRERMAEILRLQ